MGLFIIREDLIGKLVPYFPNEDYLIVPMAFDPSCPIGNHPDIHAAILGRTIVVSPRLYDFILDQPQGEAWLDKYPIIKGHLNPSSVYPDDVLYNVFCHDNRLFMKKADCQIGHYSDAHGLTAVKVKQGYVKCNTLLISDNCIITEDENLYKIYFQYFSNTILIQKGYIKLSGYDYGFMGGASGRKNQTILFNGALSFHPQGERIKSLIDHYHLNLIELCQTPLEDCGSILYFE